jgi:hypothetical protein
MGIAKFLGNKMTFGLAESATKGIGSILKGGGMKLFDSIGLKWGSTILKRLKFIPLIGTIISMHSAWKRIQSGDYLGATIDGISGIASLFPGLGTVLSIGLDVLNGFLDYKQEKTGESKGQLVGDFFGMIGSFLQEKFSYEKLRDMPFIGGLLRLGEGIGQMVGGDMVGGLKTMLSAIGWFTPLGFLPQLFSFMDYLGDGKTTSSIPDSIKNLLNPDKFVETLLTAIGGLFKGVLDMITGIFESAKKGLSGIGTSIGDWAAEKMGISDKLPPIKRSELKHVNDAVVVQPHSKDQILMAKNGGPFDLALKSMIEKLEEEKEILLNGFDMMISAIMSGSGQVAQTVAATAGTKSGGSSGSRNPANDFRTRANIHIRK